MSVVKMASEQYVDSKVDAKYTKPGSGIPASDLDAAVQSSLAKANTALQQHQDISGKADKSDTYTKNEVYKKSETYSKSEVYDKSDTYSKSEVLSLIATTGGKFLIVSELPSASSADPKAIYLVPRTASETGNIYDEYLRVRANGGPYSWEKIGSTEIDVSGKADKVVSATSGNFAGLDGNGNLTDSGTNPADFATATQGAKADAAPSRAEVEAGWWSEWTVTRNGVDVTAQVDQPEFYNNIWHASFVYDDAQMDASNPEGSDDATSLTWVGYDVGEDFAERTYTATRHRVAAPVPTKPSDIGAQPAGEYAPATNIAKTALAQDVQTSLGKADTAVQPSVLAEAVRYDLPANATAISSASSEVVDGETVTYGEATLADRTANRIAITAALDELRITFPVATSGKVRDFGLRVEIGTGSAALAAPALVPIAPTGETIKIENNAAEIPALADGAADAKGVTLLYFSETAPGVFLVKGEQVKEV